MKTKNTISILLLSFLFFSCENTYKKSKDTTCQYELKAENDKDLRFHINEHTKFSFPSLFPYTDKSGKEYLTLVSLNRNSILFYDLQMGDYLFDIQLEKEGPDGVGNIHGYHIENLDHIYITSNNFGLAVVDTSGRKKQFIEYKKTDKGHTVVPNFTSSSYIYAPAIIHEKKIYITQNPYLGSKIADIPVSISIDTTIQSFEELPFRFPDIITDEELPKIINSLTFSREFNGKQLIYSFHMDENLYIIDIETNEEKKIPIKSKYINKLNFINYSNDRERDYKLFLENSYYYNILYDKYRNLYYRFSIIGSEISTHSGYTYFDLYTNGFIQFSVIVLDKDFKIIGETLFPKYTYNPTIAFVHKNGLYISDSHILNPSFDENTLSFKCFTLKEKTGD